MAVLFFFANLFYKISNLEQNLHKYEMPEGSLFIQALFPTAVFFSKDWVSLYFDESVGHQGENF